MTSQVMWSLLFMLPLVVLIAGCDPQEGKATAAGQRHPVASGPASKDKLVKSDQEWKQTLTREQYYILRQKGTEPPFDNAYHETKEKGVYVCAGCGKELFSSDHKFDSGTGWPSYWQPIAAGNVSEAPDGGATEVLCSRCDGHLGHVFDDGPKPTGLRYCINSAAIKLVKKGAATQSTAK